MTEVASNERVERLIGGVVALIRALAHDGDVPRDLEHVPLTGDTVIGALGLDSLGRLTLLSALDESLGIYIPDDSVTEETTIRDIVARFVKVKEAIG